MKSNSLGYAVETPSAKPSSTQNVVVQMETVDNTLKIEPRWYQMNTSTMLCCILTTLLTSAGVGIGIWFALTPNNSA